MGRNGSHLVARLRAGLLNSPDLLAKLNHYEVVVLSPYYGRSKRAVC